MLICFALLCFALSKRSNTQYSSTRHISMSISNSLAQTLKEQKQRREQFSGGTSSSSSSSSGAASALLDSMRPGAPALVLRRSTTAAPANGHLAPPKSLLYSTEGDPLIVGVSVSKLDQYQYSFQPEGIYQLRNTVYDVLTFVIVCCHTPGCRLHSSWNFTRITYFRSVRWSSEFLRENRVHCAVRIHILVQYRYSYFVRSFSLQQFRLTSDFSEQLACRRCSTDFLSVGDPLR